MHSILHHWACILIFDSHFIEYVFWWKFVCELSEIIFVFVFTSSHLFFESEMSDLFLGALGHYPLHHYIHCNETSLHVWLELIITFSSYIHCFAIILIITFDSSPLLHSLVIFLRWSIPGLIFSMHHCYISHYQFDLLHCLIIDILFTLDTLRSMAHELFYTCCILYKSVDPQFCPLPLAYILGVSPALNSYVSRPWSLCWA